MRISDWSSDVCSSDLDVADLDRKRADRRRIEVVRKSQGLVPAEGADIRFLAFEIAGIQRFDRQLLQHRGRNGGDFRPGRDELLSRPRGPADEFPCGAPQIGRASCRGRGFQYVSIPGVAVVIKK